MTEENTEQTPDAQLSIGDILVLKQIVEVASARGAFRANELTQIGGVYDRVSAWVEQTVPTEGADTEEETESEGEADA